MQLDVILRFFVALCWLGNFPTRSFATLIDDSSFLVVDLAQQYFDSSIKVYLDLTASMTKLRTSYTLLPTFVVANKLAWLHGSVGQLTESSDWYAKARQLDHNNFGSLLATGISEHYNGNYHTAVLYYDRILSVDSHHEDALFNKGVSLQHAGDIQASADCYYDLIQLNPLHTKAILNMAFILHKYGSPIDALEYYRKGVVAIELFIAHWTAANGAQGGLFLPPEYIMLKSNLGACLLQLGSLKQAYREISGLTTTLTSALHQLCASDKSHCNRSTSESQSMYNSLSSARAILALIQRASAQWAGWEVNQHLLLADTLSGIDSSQNHQLQSQQGENRHKSDFQGPLLPFDTLMLPISLSDRLKVASAASDRYITRDSDDSLTAATTSATAAAPQTQAHVGSNSQHLTTLATSLAMPLHKRLLRLGFISYDFGDHPTAHLIEAIFKIVRSGRDNAAASLFSSVELIIFNYGGNDGSSFRMQLEALTDQFVEIGHLSHRSAAAMIAEHQIDILLDLQMHTLGNRMEISALQPANVLINYLVYPGTSGARFFNYIAVDSVVVPPAEHARYYSESLLVLPPSYQISYYDRHMSTPRVVAGAVGSSSDESEVQPPAQPQQGSQRPASWTEMVELRRANNLPASPQDIVFCNFNKADKIDPESFASWMAILRRVPSSYLWLLEPGSGLHSDAHGVIDPADSRVTLVKSNLCAAAEREGVACDRILYAQRTDKASHILRHAAADLFLDTLVYGAHSTATDALRGGLPVLTVLGDSFPSRVGASLYSSFLDTSSSSSAVKRRLRHDDLYNVLVAQSLREFEDTAIRLGLGAQQERMSRTTRGQTSSASLSHLKAVLHDTIVMQSGLFNTTRGVESFVRGMLSIQEVEYLIKSMLSGLSTMSPNYHVVV